MGETPARLSARTEDRRTVIAAEAKHNQSPRPGGDRFAQRRRELADATIQTLSELGYARTSLREIAQNSAFSHGVLHYYFADKVDLMLVASTPETTNPVASVCEEQGIPLANALSAGDEYNDISMIQAAGIGCAVANARPDVKAIADYVTENDNNHGAIHEIIEKFML